MKYYYLMLLLILLTSCSQMSDNNHIVETCKHKCEYDLNTTIRVGNTTNIFECSCDNL